MLHGIQEKSNRKSLVTALTDLSEAKMAHVQVIDRDNGLITRLSFCGVAPYCQDYKMPGLMHHCATLSRSTSEPPIEESKEKGGASSESSEVKSAFTPQGQIVLVIYVIVGAKLLSITA